MANFSQKHNDNNLTANKMNPTVTVYKLLEATELASQQGDIFKTLTGMNYNPNASDGLFSFAMDDTKGFFSLKNKIIDKADIVPVNVPKTEALAIQKAGELLGEYSAKVSNHPILRNLFSGLKASYANSVLHEKGYGIKQWNVHYQLHVNNDHSSKNGSKPVNGMSLTVKIGNHGKLIGMDYYMRPIKENMQSRRYKVNVETQKEIEPETELLYMSSLSQGVIAPFYNTLSYKSAPACVEAENMLNNPPSGFSSVSENRNQPVKRMENKLESIKITNLVWQIGSQDGISFFDLVDENGIAIKYDKDEKDYYGNPLIGSIRLPEGAKVIQLLASQKVGDLIRVIAFWNGKYRDGFLDRIAFQINMKEYNDQSYYVFINDMSKILFDIDNYKNSVTSFPIISKSLSIIKETFYSLTKNDLRTKFEESYRNFRKEYIEINKYDRLAKYYKSMGILKFIFRDHIDKNKITVVPFSTYFFLSNKKLDSFYRKYEDELSNYFRGSSGVFLSKIASISKEELKATDPVNYKMESHFHGKEILEDLQEYMSKFNIEDGYYVWLNNNLNQIRNSDHLLFLSDGCWNINAKNCFGDYVPINISFGPFIANGETCIIIHEMGQSNCDYYPYLVSMDKESRDTHIKPDESQKIALMLATSEINIRDLQDKTFELGALYESNIFLNIVFLASVIIYFKIN